MDASTSGKPVLLDLDYEGGHGIGDTGRKHGFHNGNRQARGPV